VGEHLCVATCAALGNIAGKFYRTRTALSPVMDGRARLARCTRRAPDHTAVNANACSWAPFGDFWMFMIPDRRSRHTGVAVGSGGRDHPITRSSPSRRLRRTSSSSCTKRLWLAVTHSERPRAVGRGRGVLALWIHDPLLLALGDSPRVREEAEPLESGAGLGLEAIFGNHVDLDDFC
jgi:hypothetical protein